MAEARPYIFDDGEREMSRLSLDVRVSEAVSHLQRAGIFAKCRTYIGHASEITRLGDFVTRIVARRAVIFCRTVAGDVRCFFNACRHRGSVVCRERIGKASRFTSPQISFADVMFLATSAAIPRSRRVVFFSHWKNWGHSGR